VAAGSKVWTVFARSNAGVVGSNDVCVRLLVFCVCVVLCVGRCPATDWSAVRGIYQLCIELRNWKSGQGPKGCRAIEIEKNSILSAGTPDILCKVFTSFQQSIEANVGTLRVIIHVSSYLPRLHGLGTERVYKCTQWKKGLWSVHLVITSERTVNYMYRGKAVIRQNSAEDALHVIIREAAASVDKGYNSRIGLI
jgi:hypothetical protein